MTLRLLDLFSGIGGFSLAARWLGGFETVQFVKKEPFCQGILRKHWPNVPIHDDICTYQPAAGAADVVVGGFPCQDISQAGKGAGLSGDRSGLFYELLRVVRLVGPRYIVLENVAALTYRGLDDVLGSLAEAGFDAEWACIPASAVGACHRRDRWWCVAYARSADGEWRTKGLGRRGGIPADAFGRWLPESGRGADSAAYAQGWRRGAGPGSCPTTAGRQGQGAGDGAAGLAADSDGQRCHQRKHPGDTNGAHAPQGAHRSANALATVGDGANAADAKIRGNIGSKEQARQQLQPFSNGAAGGIFTHPNHPGLERRQPASLRQCPEQWTPWPQNPQSLNPDWRSYVSQPVIRRGDDGFPGRVERLKALGNAVVPQVAMIPLARVLELNGEAIKR